MLFLGVVHPRLAFQSLKWQLKRVAVWLCWQKVLGILFSRTRSNMFFSPVTMTLVYHLSKILLVDFIDFGLDNVEATFLLFHFFFF